MTRVDRLFRLALPAGLTAFCWLTMRTVASFADESTASYGFPVSWYTPDAVSSMGYVIAIGPLLLDLAVYVSFSFVALLFLTRRVEQRYIKALSVTLWLMACASLFVKIPVMLISPQIVTWRLDTYYDGNARYSHGMQFGLDKHPNP